MGETQGGRGDWRWWAAASSAQMAAGIVSYRRGLGESSGAAVMPFKAFAIATLFVGAGATAVSGAFIAAGLDSVDDMKGVGAGIRRWMGAPPREAN